jgi:hypothetical protein
MDREHPHPGHGGDPREIGRWELLTACFTGSPTHAALLPTDKIFVYGGSSLDREVFDRPPPAEILDLDTLQVRQISMQGVECDLWCGGHTFLQDGKLLFVGGTSCYPPDPDPFYGGVRQAYTFDPFTETWTRLPDMREGRWYPTLIRLADNSVLAISGLQYRDPDEVPKKFNFFRLVYEVITKIKEYLVSRQEVYDPETRAWGEMAGRKIFPLYPRLHLLPDGDVFYSGVYNTHYFTPGRYPSARWKHETGEWVNQGGRHFYKNREEGISLLLALRPPDYRPRILVAGGGHHGLGRSLASILHELGKHRLADWLAVLTTALDRVELIDLCDPDPRWQLKSNMHERRIHANGVLLPDGKVLVVGGMPNHAHSFHHLPVLPAELYDPESDRWARMALPEKPRVYHSSALLLPDARVISMGGNPQPRVIEKSIEIFSPPYLFRGDRPAITSCPERITYGGPFQIKVNDTRKIGQVVLLRPEVVTHVTNTDQRLLQLEHRNLSAETLEIQGPPSRAHMPQGYCLLFALDQDGIPSVGRFLRLS